MTLQLCRRRLALVVLLVWAGCRSQTPSKPVPTDVSRRVETVLRAAMNVPPHVNLEIGERTPSDQFPGYDTLPVTFVDGERKMPVQFVISKDDKTLFQVTKYDVSMEALQKKNEETRKVTEKIDLRGRPMRGGRNAKVLIVSYDDLQCPYCTQMHQALFPTVLNRYGDRIKVIYKDFPLEQIHPWAMRAAVDSNCLARQNPDAYWGFVDYVHAHQAEINGQNRPVAEQRAQVDRIAASQAREHGGDVNGLQSCMKTGDETPVEASIQEGHGLAVDSTPTVFVNGEKINGALSVEDLEKIIDGALADAGDAPAPPLIPNVSAKQ